MIIIGCDLHTRFQQIVMLDTETGEVVEKRLEHEDGEARRFYEQLESPALVGIESTGYTLWFAEMLQELGHELAVGDAAKIRASETRGWRIRADGFCRDVCDTGTVWCSGRVAHTSRRFSSRCMRPWCG